MLYELHALYLYGDYWICFMNRWRPNLIVPMSGVRNILTLLPYRVLFTEEKKDPEFLSQRNESI
jgi:hypothetical protein